MESFIVRIYRRGTAGMELVGTVQAAAGGRREVFRSVEELWQRLRSGLRSRGKLRDRTRRPIGEPSEDPDP